MTQPTPTDLTGFAGSDVVVDFAVTRADAQGVQQPINLTGASIWWTVKYRYTDPDPGIDQLTIGDGIVVTSAVGGLFTGVLPRATTASLNAPVALVYDVKVKESSDLESTPFFGTLTIKAAATQAS